ncbi:MAG: hypothetical protein AAGF01_19605 [Cyanobacteria bacterium P01_G01_bin.38]
MYFPIWQYLNQPLWDQARPAMLDPFQYWQHYKVVYLGNCLENSFLEQCWQIDYQEFIDNHEGFCDRNVLEEDPVWLIERCWHLKRRISQHMTNLHPENLTSEET